MKIRHSLLLGFSALLVAACGGGDPEPTQTPAQPRTSSATPDRPAAAAARQAQARADANALPVLAGAATTQEVIDGLLAANATHAAASNDSSR